MRILGIDPGIGRTGWGVIEKKGVDISVVNFGLIETSQTQQMHIRLEILYDKLQLIYKEYKPDTIAVEELFFNTNAKTAFIVGQARGVVLLTSSINHVTPFIYTPLQVKIAITGYGRAEKNQIGEMVKKLLKLKTIPKPDDVADALAIAITHAFSVRMNML